MRCWGYYIVAMIMVIFWSAQVFSGPVTPNPYVTDAKLGLATSHLITNLQAHKNSTVPAGGHPAAGNNRQVQYNNNGSFAGAAYLNCTGGLVRIGTPLLPAANHLEVNSTDDVVNYSQAKVSDTTNSSFVSYMYSATAARQNAFNFFRYGGTPTAPTRITKGSNLAFVTGTSYAGSATSASAQIRFMNYSIHSATTSSGYLSFWTNGGSANPTERVRIDKDGKFGIGTTSPSQIFQVGNGFQVYTSGKVKLPSTSMALATEEGLIWKNQHTFYGNHYQVTRSFNMAHGIQVSDTTVGNTTTETTVYTAAQAANYPTAGKTIRIKLLGYLSKTAAATLTIRLKVGSTTLLTSTVASTGSPLTNVPLHGDWYFTYRTVGASGTCISSASVDVNNTSIDASATATTTVDTTASNNITVTFQWSAADVGNTTTVTQGYTETLGALEMKNTWYAIHQETLARREEYA